MLKLSNNIREEKEMAKEQTASMEDYLEAIALLSERKKVVRVNELSKALGVKMPSITSALKKLSELGLVEHERYGYVTLTEEGNKIAADVIQRHEILSHFLTDILNIDLEVAEEDACKMEHSLSQKSLERLAKFVEFVLTHHQREPEWLKAFNRYFE